MGLTLCERGFRVVLVFRVNVEAVFFRVGLEWIGVMTKGVWFAQENQVWVYQVTDIF